jgi:hypothetical protein
MLDPAAAVADPAAVVHSYLSCRQVDEAQYAFAGFVWIGYANGRCVA